MPENTMKRIWTIIGVRDVPGSFKWYQSLFGQPETAPGHDYWGQICDSDGAVLMTSTRHCRELALLSLDSTRSLM
jgi:hypothetical protein